MKRGANFSQQNRITKLGAEGMPAQEIAARMSLPLECVESFLPKPEPKPEPKPRKSKGDG